MIHRPILRFRRPATLDAAVLGCVLALALSGVASAQTEIHRQVDAAADGKVSIESFAGSLVIRGWQRPLVEVSGTLGRDVEELEVEKQGRNVNIELKFDKRRNPNRVSAHLEIQVPVGSRVVVEAVSAEVTFDGITGEIEGETVSGDLTVEGSPRSLNLDTVSGEVDIVAPTELCKVETVSGDVTMVGVGGRVDVTTVSGDVDLLSDQLRQLTAELVSGDLDFQGKLAPGSELEVSSHSGEVALFLPTDTSASFRVETFSGSIRNDLGPPAKRVNRYTPGRELSFKMGSGAARVRIESFSGSVELRERK